MTLCVRALVLPLSPRTRRSIDVVLAIWVALWIVLGIRVGDEMRGLADLSETVIRSGVAVTESAEALDSISNVPFVGGQVDEAISRAREAGESARASGRSSERSVQNLSILLGLAIAIIPSLPIVGFYVPVRLSLVREAAAVRDAMAAGDDDQLAELLAGRAAHTLPYRRLAAVSADPIEDLRAGRYGPLAAAELERLGLAELIPDGWKGGG